ncbi:MAG: HAMP domain-containing protein, partial [Sphingomicrobium sp.]
MDATTTDSGLIRTAEQWLARERESGRFYRWATIGLVIFLAAMLLFSVNTLINSGKPGTFLSPPLIALLLVANLIPAIALMVLLSRKVAMARAEKGGLAGGRVHTRLVALFSVIAAVPTVMVAIFASLLFQSGLEFWFSDRAKSMVENSVELGRTTYNREVERVINNTATMDGDLSGALAQVQMSDPAFADYILNQVYARELTEAIIFSLGPKGEIDSLALVNPYDRPLNQIITPDAIDQLQGRTIVALTSPDRIGALTKMKAGSGIYLYAAKVFDPEFKKTIERTKEVQSTYSDLLERSRIYQLRFNGALLLGALLIVALAIFTALKIADRLVRPVGQLVAAAGRVEEGDFSTRVPVHEPNDEIALLSTAFNRMTGRLQEQTGALVSANEQLETRRAFIEAVLSSVTAGVVALDADGNILLVNRSAENLLEPEGEEIEGRNLKDLSADLAEFMVGEARDSNVTIAAEGGQRTLAVKRVRYADGAVLTFDDITDQLSDQRRAAWSDIAQRIAHEIRNPLTPIQLAAERLQRRYGAEVTSDPEVFERLTGTIIRQVGDLRN